MKKLSFIVSVLAILVTACVPVTTSTIPSEPPVAYIDSVLPPTITQGEKLTFSGHGTAKTGSVVAFQWRSSQDGIISNAPSFSTSGLSVARHTIYFRVQNNTGEWSPEVYFFINIVPAGASKPVINTFICSPENIVEGTSSTLTWNVTNATKVMIDPDIGNVSLVGTRTVSPRVTTTYVITAINDAGQVSNETKLYLTNTPSRTIELRTLVQENSAVRYDGITSPIPVVGVKDGPYQWQCFLTFDISMIPQNAVIKSASLDISNYEIVGSPFNNLSNMGVFAISMGRIGNKSYVTPYPGGALFSVHNEPSQPISSGMLINSIQELVSLKSTRYQIRMQFEKYYYTVMNDNYLSFFSDKPRLIITYEN